MSHFNDNLGRRWSVELTVNTIERIRAFTGIDLIGGSDTSKFIVIMSDPILIVDAMYAICRPQASSLALTEQAFTEAITGEAIGDAATAFHAAAEAFFPPVNDSDPKTPIDANAEPQSIREAIYSLAGVVGVDPHPLTCRQLKWMAEARQAAAWDMISWMCHIIFCASPFRNGKPPSPMELNPSKRVIEKSNFDSWEEHAATFAGVTLPPGVKIATLPN